MNAKQKLISYLTKTNGHNTFTVAQARNMFKIRNVTARIAELRREGHCIYTNSKKLEDGRKIQFYRIGKPSKELIAAAYQSGYLR